MLLRILRNIVFYPVFYTGSILITGASLALMPISVPAFRRMVPRWGKFQRWCLKYIIGCTVEVEGERVEGPVLYAIKHESFFEAIDAPNLLDTPSVFAKQELFSIPGWGPAAKAYGLIPVATGGRGQGTDDDDPRGPPLFKRRASAGHFPRRDAHPAWRYRAIAVGICGSV